MGLGIQYIQIFSSFYLTYGWRAYFLAHICGEVECNCEEAKWNPLLSVTKLLILVDSDPKCGSRRLQMSADFCPSQDTRQLRSAQVATKQRLPSPSHL